MLTDAEFKALVRRCQANAVKTGRVTWQHKPRYAPYVEVGTKPRNINGQFARSKEQKCPYCNSLAVPVSGKCPNCNGPMKKHSARPQRKPETPPDKTEQPAMIIALIISGILAIGMSMGITYILCMF